MERKEKKNTHTHKLKQMNQLVSQAAKGACEMCGWRNGPENKANGIKTAN